MLDPHNEKKARPHLERNPRHFQKLLAVEPGILWKARQVMKFSPRERLADVFTLNDAYETAHELETSEINTVFTFIMKKFLPWEKRKEFLNAEFKEHQDKLIAFNKNFGDAGWRQGILPEKQP